MALHQRLEEMLLLLRRPDLAEQIHVAFIGRGRVAGQRAERRQAALLQDMRGLALGEMRAVVQDVRRQHAGGARLAAHLGHEFIGRSVARPPRIVLVGDDRLPDKRLDPIGDLVRAGGWVGHGPLLCLPSELVGKDAGLIQPLADGRAAPGHAWDYRIGAMADQRFSGTCGAGSAFAPGYDETPAPEFFGA